MLRDARGRVARFAERDELDALARLQTRGFYEPALGRGVGAIDAIDGPLRAAFAWDVARTLRKKYAYARAGRFAPLVATVDDVHRRRVRGVDTARFRGDRGAARGARRGTTRRSTRTCRA